MRVNTPIITFFFILGDMQMNYSRNISSPYTNGIPEIPNDNDCMIRKPISHALGIQPPPRYRYIR